MNYRLFHFGSINIYSYGVMVAIAFIVGIVIAARRAKQLNEDPQNILDLCLYLMISSIAGARICYVVTNWDYYRNNLFEIVLLNRGGLVFYGGVIFAIVTAVSYLKLKKLRVWNYLDILTPSLAIGHALGRIGCFLNGCCYGRIVWNAHLKFLGIRFPQVTELTDTFSERIIGSPAYIDQLNQGFVKPTDLYSLPVYPTQLFETGFNIVIFFILLHMFKKRRFEGQIWWAYTMMYAVSRFLVEFVRGDNPIIPATGMTLSQNLAIIFFITGIIMYFVLRKKQHA